MCEGDFEMATATETDEYETESGIILGGDDLVSLIKTEITKIREKNQRADCSKICKVLEKTHGLSLDVIQTSLNYMLKCGKIKDVPHAGRESLRIQSESNDELEVSKSRILADEEKVKKYRDEILEIASMHEGNLSRDEQDTVSSISDEAEVQFGGIWNIESSPGKCFNKMQMDPQNKYQNKENSTSQETLACILDRLTKIEGRVDEITKKSTENPPKNEKISSVDFTIFFARISQLEQENKSLRDENMGLKFENRKLKESHSMGEVAFRPRDPISRFQYKVPQVTHHNVPKQSSTTQRPQVNSNETHSRYANNVADGEWKVQSPKSKVQREASWGTNVNGREFPFSKPLDTANRFSCLENLTTERESTQVPSDREYSAAVKSQGFPQTTSSRSMRQHKVTALDKREGDWENSWAANSKTRSEDARRPRKPVFSILGDSMVKKIRRQDINAEVSHAKTSIKTFPGATIDQMKSYIKPAIDDKLDGIIILCGTNNLRSESPEETAKKLIDLATETKKKLRDVTVSSIIKRTDSHELEMKRRKVNDLVKVGLSRSNISFIEHDNIESRHLDKWGLHLNFQGNNVSTGNLINFLNGV